MSYDRVIEEIVNRIEPGADTAQLEKLKASIARNYHLSKIPRNSEIVQYARARGINLNLVTKPSRSISGVTVLAVMSRPFPCPPNAQCIYCPGGVDIGTPKSYTGYEPASMRGKQNLYDPFYQVRSRLDQLTGLGHSVSKNEVIVMGGTFLSFPQDYQEWFIKGIYDGLNEHMSPTMNEAVELNETAKNRCVGLTVETRPDYCREEHVDMMLRYGGTRVELGVQTLDESVLKKVHRGHSISDTVDAFRIAKDAGFKVVAHMMPGLPNSSVDNDLASFNLLFGDERFRPDMIKIYPTLVVEGTLLYKMYKMGLYKPLTNEAAAEIVAKVMEIAPPWIRIMRVQRDIPAFKIKAGPTAGNLRELALEILRLHNKTSQEIRFREVGFRKIDPSLMATFRIRTLKYRASNGDEYFISYENDAGDIAGYLRLRKPSELAHREEARDSAIVRELRVVGRVVAVGESGEGWQHRGIGSMLMNEAEKITREEIGAKKVIVISGIGVRNYYRKLGYEREGPYMAKVI
ncbi:MAG: tRNA uridine(34) 5-carboxymethylaminomethyl modification radical SAM/GNAT enzyme Elp3 [Nitrososphaerota archaeon]|jgi:elongator complex protein 3|nr:tRNA uridine(34) 5-carboxymethylaminomethyl modification radical SAM/GNAT enzyme Elp3 [Nitrososphaerota archaeon]MDG6932374.1 tRNA uridine(34) 5-carboxymethylaminomethyl modification radical SAM/GNAT enzyme Elp3 [Nitrososphaerota archaeon]MDG6935933.1 tRNA uridine(34) 5-carboxymethylaminomethyl modification radical SAM/GNAT enzyme Elp3 [Nitrososphaerota archaeon]MDG6943779.1 tRNA uridine(34) 5-carboxymethylaminomethyl modification radical SAM/GNAT enzyme Elp3 [Nitrososphaerota archaeon]